MVIINDNTITISFKGDTEDYLNYIHSLTRVIATQHNDFLNSEDNYFVASLLKEMLPEPGQKIKIN